MTSQSQSEQELLQQFVATFQSAEAVIKAAENSAFFRSKEAGSKVDKRGLFIPAINELRNAGYHIADYFKNGKQLSVQKAISHCVRAAYEAYDCQINFFFCECRQFQNDYRTVVISSVIPDYVAMTQRLNEMLSDTVVRMQDHEQIIENKRRTTEDLVNIYCRFQAARDELNKIVEEKLRMEAREKDREKRSSWRTVVATVVGAILGAVVTFVFSFLR